MKYHNIINNLIEDNYYDEFKKGNKSLCLTFYYNYRINNTRVTPQSNSELILLHLNYLLDFYIEKQFKCNIKINDELWLTDLEYRDKIIDIFIQKFTHSNYKPKEITIISNAIHCLGEKQYWFINLVNKFNKNGIKIKLNFETMLIDIVDVEYLFEIKNFLLNYSNKLKIRINPNNFVYFTEIFDSLYLNFKPILYLFEEDNVNWTDHKINEYVEFLDKYIDRIYTEKNNDNIEFLKELVLNENLNLISLNNSNKQSCSFYQSLNILLEDLSINLCPKFQHNNEIIGQYICENNQITDIEPKVLMNAYLKNLNPHCEICAFNIFCKGFCCKESYRYHSNPIIPIQESCENKKVKYAFLFFKLKELNVMTMENFKQIPNIDIMYIENILNLYNQITQRI